MARVSVEQKALTDPRFDLLGRFLESNRHDALGRMILVWNECQERGTYTLPERLVGAVMGDRDGAGWVVEADLASWVDKKTIRIKGTEGRVEWLEAKRERARLNGMKGGRPTHNQNGTNIGSEKTHSGLQPETPPAPAPAPAPAQKTENQEPPQPPEAGGVDLESRSKRTSRKKKEPFDPLSPALPFSSDAFRSAWAEWAQHRASGGKGGRLTELSAKKQLEFLAGIGESDAIESINASIRSNWQGLFVPGRRASTLGQTSENGSHHRTAAGAVEEALRRQAKREAEQRGHA